MKNQLILSFLFLAVYVSCGSALKCFECESRKPGVNESCSLMGEEFKKDGEGLRQVDCPSTDPDTNETGIAVCGKTITQLTRKDGEVDYMSSRYCDILADEDHRLYDTCDYSYGGPSSTWACTCATDLCNTATNAVVSMATLSAALALAVKLL